MLPVLQLARDLANEDFQLTYHWFVTLLLFQDPELEAKRKAELEKIRSQKKKFKQKIQENIQRQKQGQLKKKLMKKQIKKKKAESASSWKLLHVHKSFISV